jgi:hypothetical protein
MADSRNFKLLISSKRRSLWEHISIYLFPYVRDLFLKLFQLVLQCGSGPPSLFSFGTRAGQFLSLKINYMAGFDQPTFRLPNAPFKLCPGNLHIGQFLASCVKLCSQLGNRSLSISH